MEIQLSRAKLRKPGTEDAQSMAKHANNAKIAANMRNGFPHPYTLENAQQWIEMVNTTPKSHILAIEVDNEVAGGVGIHYFDDIYCLGGEIGYWLGEPHWNKGIATEALKAMVQYAFTNTDLIRLQAGVFEHNPGSRRVLEKAGFTLEGIRKKAVFKNNTVQDEYLYALLKN